MMASEQSPQSFVETPPVLPLSREQLREASGVLTEAFMDDPMFRFLVPKEMARRRWLGRYMGAGLRLCFPNGQVFGTSTADGTLAGVIAGSAPGQYPPPFRRELGFFGRLLPHALRGQPSPRRAMSSARTLNRLGRLHFEGPHWYVYELGVLPELAGRGLGRRLMDDFLARADEEGRPVYLETSNEVNLGFYRRFGFEVRDTVHGPGGVPPVWTMLRGG